MYHYVYQITNKIDGRIYIGLRSSKVAPIYDRYMDSSKSLSEDLKRFGEASFEKVILHEFQTREDARLKESELVTWEFCGRIDTYNRIKGGLEGADKQSIGRAAGLLTGKINGKLKWWTNGTINKRSNECPGEEFRPGITERITKEQRRLITANAGSRGGKATTKTSSTKSAKWWNNGSSNTRSPYCPGEGWVEGRYGFKKGKHSEKTKADGTSD